jgi:hypothetical protein
MRGRVEWREDGAHESSYKGREMNDRQRFLAKCITVVCVAAVCGGVYLVIDGRERERETERHEKVRQQTQSAIGQFDSAKAEGSLYGYFNLTYGHANYRLVSGFGPYVYVPPLDEFDSGTFQGGVTADINFSDTGWQRCLFSVAFYPTGTLTRITQSTTEPLPKSPTAASQ